MVTVSILIAVYNAEKTIERCLNAIINQTFMDFEVICVDDGSSDNSLQLLESFAQKDSRIKVYHQENLGVAAARNNAMSKVCGEYVMFCDSDDWYEPDMVEEMVKTIKEQNVDVVMCDADVIDLAKGALQTENNITYNRLKYMGFQKITTKFVRNTNVLLWNKIFKNELIKKYDITYPLKYEHDDMVFVYKYFAVAKTYFGLNKKLYHYYVGNQNSIMGKCFTNKNAGKEFDYIYAFEELLKFMQKHPNLKYSKEVEKHAVDIFNFFTKFLDVPKQYEAYRIFREFVLNSGYFSNRAHKVRMVKKTKNFDNYLKCKTKARVSFIQKIFSVRNEYEHKVVRIAGFKMSF